MKTDKELIAMSLEELEGLSEEEERYYNRVYPDLLFSLMNMRKLEKSLKIEGLKK